jgi:hypothetical protein
MRLENLKKIKVNVTDVVWEGEQLSSGYYVTLGVNKYIQEDGVKEKVKEFLNTRHKKSKVKSFNIKDVKDL